MFKLGKLAIGITSTVLYLGITSFLTDVSTEAMLALLPAYLLMVLKIAPELVGVIEGIAESATAFLRLFSGALADIKGKRKLITTAGYALSNAVKPLMGLAYTWDSVLTIRVLDRVGKGIRTPPRDSMIADASVEGKVGRAFGVHRTLDQLGAVIGPLVAFALLPFLGYSGVFFSIAIPGGLAVLVIALFVKEPPMSAKLSRERLVKGFSKLFKGSFAYYMASVAAYSLASFSFIFVIYRASELAGLDPSTTVLLYALIQAFHVASGIPAGELFDRVGGVKAVAISYLTLTLCYLMLSLKLPALMVFLALAVYGLHKGFIETTQRAIIPSLVDPRYKSSAYGLYNTMVGAAILPSNILAGFLYSAFGGWAVFIFGTISSLLATALLLPITRRKASTSITA